MMLVVNSTTEVNTVCKPVFVGGLWQYANKPCDVSNEIIRVEHIPSHISV